MLYSKTKYIFNKELRTNHSFTFLHTEIYYFVHTTNHLSTLKLPDAISPNIVVYSITIEKLK